MKIEDKIYVPHICPECNTGRMILRDDLHDKPTIICTECGAEMKWWILHKEAPFEPFSGQYGYYLTYTQALRETTGSPWDSNSGSSLVDVRKKVGQDLVDYPGMPEMVLLPSEYGSAQIRAELMQEKYEDLVVTLVFKSRFTDPVGTIQVESIRHSLLAGRITELKQMALKNDGHVFIILAYSEETKQEFWWNDMELGTKPRLPRYGQEYDRKRKAFRNTTDGVI